MNPYKTEYAAIPYEQLNKVIAQAHFDVVQALASVTLESVPNGGAVEQALADAFSLTEDAFGLNYPLMEWTEMTLRDAGWTELADVIKGVYDAYVDASRCQYCGEIGGH